ncbi:hypothetical protein DSECCO2_288730 [anaerobic digester metagenome]
MPNPFLHERAGVLRYVDERRCDGGGYCFYRLPEPNVADTRYALAVRSRLGPVPTDPATAAFLRSLQRPDGSFPNVFVAGHILAGLAILGESPRHDPGGFLLTRLAGLRDHERPSEQLSALEGVRVTVDACRQTGTPIDAEMTQAVLRYVHHFRHPGGGFGAVRPTIVETADAVQLFVLLGRPAWAADAGAFVADAESPSDGLIYLEPAAALVRASLFLQQRPRALERTRAFILGLHHHSGGFVRSRYGGSPTLEYTYLAIETLAGLDTLRASAGPSLCELADRCP